MFLMIVRGLHLGSGLLFLGVVAFRWLVLLPALATVSKTSWQIIFPVFRTYQRVFLGSGLLFLGSGFLWFWAVVSDISARSLWESLSPGISGAVLERTEFGQVSQVRFMLALVAGLLMVRGVLCKRFFSGKRTWEELLKGILCLALMGLLSLTSHLASSSKPFYLLRVFVDLSHLVASSVWPTGLVFLFIFLVQTPNSEAGATLRVIVLSRFSRISFFTVGVIALSGLIGSLIIVPSFASLYVSDYGRLLSLKIILFLGLVGLGTLNRYGLVPRLQAGGESWVIAQRLQAVVLIEIILAILVGVVAGILGATAPPEVSS